MGLCEATTPRDPLSTPERGLFPPPVLLLPEATISSPSPPPRPFCSLLFIWNNNSPPVWLGQWVSYALTDPSKSLAGETQLGEGDFIPPSLGAHSLVERGEVSGHTGQRI